MVTNDLQERLNENKRQQSAVRKNDKQSQQRLEDERIALLLQNEVFLEELRRNPDFISSLDRGICPVLNLICVADHSLLFATFIMHYFLSKATGDIFDISPLPQRQGVICHIALICLTLDLGKTLHFICFHFKDTGVKGGSLSQLP